LDAIVGVVLLNTGVLLIRIPLQTFFGLLLPQFLLPTLESVDLDHVGALSLVLPVRHLLGLNILKMNDWFRIVAVLSFNLLVVLIIQKSERTMLLRLVTNFVEIVPRVVLNMAARLIERYHLVFSLVVFVELLDRS
jgi:hypothetical protein